MNQRLRTQVPPLPLRDARHCFWVLYMQWVAPCLLAHHSPAASAGVGAARAITPVSNTIEVAPRIHLRTSAGTSWAFGFRIVTSLVRYGTVHVWNAPQYQVITWLKSRNHPCRKPRECCSTPKPTAATETISLPRSCAFYGSGFDAKNPARCFRRDLNFLRRARRVCRSLCSLEPRHIQCRQKDQR